MKFIKKTLSLYPSRKSPWLTSLSQWFLVSANQTQFLWAAIQNLYLQALYLWRLPRGSTLRIEYGQNSRHAIHGVSVFSRISEPIDLAYKGR